MEQISGPPGFHPAGRVYGRRRYGSEYCHHPLRGVRHCSRDKRNHRSYGPGEVPHDDSGGNYPPTAEITF